MARPNTRPAAAGGLTFVLLLAAAGTGPADDPPKPADKGRELATLADAVAFALADDRLPEAATLKLEKARWVKSGDGQMWDLTFRGADKAHTLKLKPNGDFKLDSADGEPAKPGFWAKQPAPKAVAADAPRRVETAQKEAAKAKFAVGKAALIEYETGFREYDRFRERWTVSLGEDKAGDDPTLKCKTVVIEDGKVKQVGDGTLTLFKLPF